MEVSIAFNGDTGYYEIHKQGCGHVRMMKYDDTFRDIEVSTIKDCVDEAWGPKQGSYYIEEGCTEENGWMEFSVRFAPCSPMMVDETQWFTRKNGKGWTWEAGVGSHENLKRIP